MVGSGTWREVVLYGGGRRIDAGAGPWWRRCQLDDEDALRVRRGGEHLGRQKWLGCSKGHSLRVGQLAHINPDVRPDAEALDLLKAWGTGHPGGIGTIHAGTALGALRRMEQLIQEAVVTVPRALLAETIDLIAVLVRDGHGRRLAELARVEGLDAATGDYRLTPLTTPQTGDLP